jgi:hypothetical protein
VILELTDPQVSGLLFVYRKGYAGLDSDTQEMLDCLLGNVVQALSSANNAKADPKPEPKHKNLPSPSKTKFNPGDLGELEGTAGWVVARIIDLAADGLVAHAIHVHLSEWVESPDDIQAAIDHYADKIRMCASFTEPDARHGYLLGVAYARNQRDENRKLKAAKP